MQGNLEERPLEHPNHEQHQKINHNGFTNTPPFTQVLPPILVLSIFGLSLAQVHNKNYDLTIIILFDGLLIGLLLADILLWFQATKIVPTDSIQLRHLDAIQKGETFDSSGSSSFCQTCQTYINKTSFHCKKCQRCVQFFDHHCKWLNNCIGAKNYFEFYGLLLVTFALFSICIAQNAYILTLNEGNMHQASFIISIIVICLSSVPNAWLLYLISLHTYLIIAKRTTIELILQNRKKNKTNSISPIKCNNNPVKKIIKFEMNLAVKDQEVPVHNLQNRTDPQENHNETNHVLIRSHLSDKEGIDKTTVPSHKQTKTLPPIKVKILSNGQVLQLRKSHNINPILTENP